MNTEVIQVNAVTKQYKLYNTPVDRLKEALHPFGKKYHRDFYAVDNLSMKITKGQSVGIIGMNGSGKSTILQIIAGVLTATSGNVEVRGRVAALLELGGGFNPEFTGMENIHFQCSIMGIPSQELDDFIHNILDFAEIGEFAHQPVKTYSSGMYVRLAFSIAVNVQPEILIVDEALAVGDAYFQNKCMERIRDFKQTGGTLLFVSHDPGAVKTLCDHTYLLHKGKVVDSGKPNEVFNHYNSLLALQSPEYDNEPLAKKKLRKRSGNNKLIFESAKILNQSGENVETFVSGETITIILTVRTNDEVDNPTIGIMIRDRLGNDIFGTNNYLMDCTSGFFGKGETKEICYSMPLDIGAGNYGLTVALHTDATHVADNFDWVNNILVFKVIPSSQHSFTGYCRLKPDFSVNNLSVKNVAPTSSFVV